MTTNEQAEAAAMAEYNTEYDGPEVERDRAIRVIEVSGVADLYCQYRGQSSPQPCYIELDCAERTLAADYNAEIGGGVPQNVWHGHIRRYPIPCLTASAANALMRSDRVQALAARVCAGYESAWDGNNHVATFSDDADAADDELGVLLWRDDWDPDDCVNAWDVADWMAGMGTREQQRAELGITAVTDDDQLDEIADRLSGELAANEVVDGLRSYLGMLRDEDQGEDA